MDEQASASVGTESVADEVAALAASPSAALEDVGEGVGAAVETTAAKSGAPNYRWAAVALFFLALIWGYAWVVIKIALDYSQPFTFAAMRTFFGVIALFAVMPLLRRPVRPKALRLTAVLGVMQTTGFVGLLTLALVSGGAGKTSILTYTMPFWLLLMAWAFLGERLKGFQWVAVGLALCGLVLLLAPWSFHEGWSGLIAVGGALFWAGSAIVAKILRKRHEVDLFSMTAWQMLLGSVLLIVFAAITWSGPPVWTGTFIAALVYVVILGNTVAWLLWLYILHALPAGTAGLGTLLTPVIGIVAAWIQLGERPTLSEGLGMIAIVSALLLTVMWEIVSARRRRAAASVGMEPGGPPTESPPRRSGGGST